jgi:hypothetical protein
MTIAIGSKIYLPEAGTGGVNELYLQVTSISLSTELQNKMYGGERWRQQYIT